MHTLLVEQEGPLVIVTMNRPEVLNALNLALFHDLMTLFQTLQNESHIKALILTGTGKAFISGADIKEMHAMTPEGMQEFCRLGHHVANLLESAPFLTIAAVNGYALGGGLEMALVCDFIYAHSLAKLGLPEVSLGLIPGFGGTQRLARAVGIRRAKELILTGKIFSAQEAYEFGIVNRVYEKDLLSETKKQAQTLLQHSFFALMHAKKVIQASEYLSKQNALELEINSCVACFATPECKAAMATFLKGKS